MGSHRSGVEFSGLQLRTFNCVTIMDTCSNQYGFPNRLKLSS